MVNQGKEISELADLLEYPSNHASFSWQKLVKAHPLQVVLLILGGGLVLLGGLLVFRSLQRESQVTIIPVEESSQTTTNQIMVHVAGAVQKPGLYQLSAKARINDALSAAGGLSQDANREWFATNINLAQKVSDGVKLYIPFAGEAGVTTGLKIDSNQVGLDSSAGLVNINTASATELESLPKIGPVTAQRIIEYRETHGAFQSVDDLVNVTGISPKTLEVLRNEVTIF